MDVNICLRSRLLIADAFLICIYEICATINPEVESYTVINQDLEDSEEFQRNLASKNNRI